MKLKARTGSNGITITDGQLYVAVYANAHTTDLLIMNELSKKNREIEIDIEVMIDEDEKQK